MLFWIACFICFVPEFVRSRLCADSCQKPTLLLFCSCLIAITSLQMCFTCISVYIHPASANSVACVRNSFIRAFQYIHYTPARVWRETISLFVSYSARLFFHQKSSLILWSMEGCIMSTCNLRIPYLHVLFQIQLFKNQEWAALTFLKLINVM